ncbi:hypothetical protein I541_5603 [Mycobacteroides abscessus]|nr:hypothetical protein I541_5603 [Mycobacteroides abscessus]
MGGKATVTARGPGTNNAREIEDLGAVVTEGAALAPLTTLRLGPWPPRSFGVRAPGR